MKKDFTAGHICSRAELLSLWNNFLVFNQIFFSLQLATLVFHSSSCTSEKSLTLSLMTPLGLLATAVTSLVFSSPSWRGAVAPAIPHSSPHSIPLPITAFCHCSLSSFSEYLLLLGGPKAGQSASHGASWVLNGGQESLPLLCWWPSCDAAPQPAAPLDPHVLFCRVASLLVHPQSVLWLCDWYPVISRPMWVPPSC